MRSGKAFRDRRHFPILSARARFAGGAVGMLAAWLAIFSSAAAEDAVRPAGGQAVQALETDTHVRFLMLGDRPQAPAPLLLNLALDAERTLGDPVFLRCGNQLREDGFVCVSVDPPCHGAERREGEPEGIAGWRTRIEAGEDPMAELAGRVKKVLDYLVRERIADPDRIFACGTSRGGFAAIHMAAADSRIRGVAAYSPVTDLEALREFDGVKDPEPVRRLALAGQVPKLLACPIWIMIGDHDERVGTDHAVRFARALSAAAAERGTAGRVELHVCPSAGHRSPPGAEELSAAWIRGLVKAQGAN